MKLSKARFFSFILFVCAIVITNNAFALTMAVPTGQQTFPSYGPIALPVTSTDPSQAKPIGVGPIAYGGSTINLQINLPLFSGPVDIYYGTYAPLIDPYNVYILTSSNGFQPVSAEFTPWVANTSGNINVSLFGDISASAIPSGTYVLYLVVTPAGSLDTYYFWSTEFTVTPPLQANNVLPITVNGSLCSSDSYLNKPCVSVTVCTPGTSMCQTINDILLDTGSYGLRLFKQALNVSLVQEISASGSIAECVQFGDGSSNWGPVQRADIILGNEPAVEVPIQVIDSTFGTAPVACQNADQGPADAGFNGILGAGFFAQDCGPACAIRTGNGMYYSCSGTTCTGSSVTLDMQVQNPVALLPNDNNGVLVQLPGIPAEGTPSVNGNLILGIGTQSNNIPSSVSTYAADQYGDFTTIFNGTIYDSFIDTGSNALFFPRPSTTLLPNCSFPNAAWFCPSSIISLSATTVGASGSPSGVVPFQIGNLYSLLSSPNNVFNNIGGDLPGWFDWGLPFFFGRNVYLGLEGSRSSLGIGPYWAY